MTTTPTGYGHLGGTGLDEQILGRAYDHAVMVRLLGYVRPYKSTTVLAILGMIGFIATTVAQPLIIAWGIEAFIVTASGESQQWGDIYIVSLFFFLNTLANLGSNFLQYIYLAKVSVNVLDDLRRDMFSHLQSQSTSFYDRNEVGRIMSRVQNDVLELQEFLDVGVIALGDIALLGFIAVVMFTLNPTLTVVTFSVTPVLFAILVVWQRYAMSTFVRVRKAISAVNGSLQENISGIRVSQSMNRQAVNLNRFDRLNGEHRDSAVRAAYLSAQLMPVVETLTVLSMGLVTVVGGIMVFDGSLEVGYLVAFLLYVQRFFEPIRTLTMQYTQFQRAMASGARIFELLDVVPEMVDKSNAVELPHIEGGIKFENVSFSYTAGLPVLDHINLEVRPGQTVALVGLTGAGKTTLASLVARFYDVTDGRITVDGYDIRDVTRESLTRQTSMVLQEPFLYSTTVTENIRYRHRGLTDRQIVDAAQAVGAHEFIMTLDQGYDTVLAQRGINLSMGQRQLVSFARALAAEPRIIILDEATANIDSHTEQVIQQALKHVLKGRTSIVIAHRLSTITTADIIVVLEQGRIKETGSHRELIDRNGLYAKLYSMNFTQMIAEDQRGNATEQAGRELLEETSP